MVGYFRLGIYETLYFMQKTDFFNLLFHFQTFTSFVTNLALAINYDFAWDLSYANLPDKSLQVNPPPPHLCLSVIPDCSQ